MPYGWILHYPNDKSEITGIIYEPWHYRYAGTDAPHTAGPVCGFAALCYLFRICAVRSRAVESVLPE